MGGVYNPFLKQDRLRRSWKKAKLYGPVKLPDFMKHYANIE